MVTVCFVGSVVVFTYEAMTILQQSRQEYRFEFAFGRTIVPAGMQFSNEYSIIR